MQAHAVGSSEGERTEKSTRLEQVTWSLATGTVFGRTTIVTTLRPGDTRSETPVHGFRLDTLFQG